jgi:hypothetical protein
MDTTAVTAPKKPGEQLKTAERLVLVSKILDELSAGYMSTYALAKKLRTSKQTIDRYRPLADKIIAEQKLDRNVIRNLQIKRTYVLIEQLMEDLKASKEAKDRALYYNQIYKFSSHLALITGLNVETHVIADPTKLVIIRSKSNKKQTNSVIDDAVAEQSDSVPA